MTKKEETIRELWDDVSDEHPALIILDSDGELYSSQTGGCMCDHPVARGHLFTFEQLGITHDHKIFNELHKHFCPFGETNDESRAIIQKLGPFELLEGSQQEAWLRVLINHGPFKHREAILVHGNCD